MVCLRPEAASNFTAATPSKGTVELSAGTHTLLVFFHQLRRTNRNRGLRVYVAPANATSWEPLGGRGSASITVVSRGKFPSKASCTPDVLGYRACRCYNCAYGEGPCDSTFCNAASMRPPANLTCPQGTPVLPPEVRCLLGGNGTNTAWAGFHSKCEVHVSGKNMRRWLRPEHLPAPTADAEVRTGVQCHQTSRYGAAWAPPAPGRGCT